MFPRSRTWKRKTVWTRAHELASSAQIRERVHYLMAAAAKANEVDVALVLKEYLTRLRADPRELTEIRVSACRYCWGAGHRRQFTDGELEDARARHDDLRAACVAAGKDDPGEFDERGGGGYSRALKPNADCPTCGGDGEARVRLRDSETYSEGAIALFGGVKETKEGIEVKLADRDHALMQLARHVNFFEQDNARDLNLTVDVAELDAFYDEAMRKSREAGERARARGRAIAAEAAGLREPAADG
ncbi:terminase small subunit [Rubrivivax benzoatilyticus JA2 = ATCC BAA-35]|nr:terminase small subunit [Rubrivivax benzoatilyticus JA2 = ATCC BAA-35]